MDHGTRVYLVNLWTYQLVHLLTVVHLWTLFVLLGSPVRCPLPQPRRRSFIWSMLLHHRRHTNHKLIRDNEAVPRVTWLRAVQLAPAISSRLRALSRH